MTEQAAWVALSLVRGVGGVTMQALLARFGTAQEALTASETDLRTVRGIGQKTAAAIQSINLTATAQNIARWQSAGIYALPSHVPAYPPRLHTINDRPPTLFVQGQLPTPEIPSIAVVGTRSPSPAAQQQAARAGERLARAGAAIISGMALGVDGLAMKAALSVSGSRTVGVLGSGVLVPYPQQHAALAHLLRMYGALVCEVAPDATVSTPGLVARNRLISGMADAVLIIETAADGGAMHAARAAYKQGRALWAVENAASGNRKLLASGHARPVHANLSNLLDLLPG